MFKSMVNSKLYLKQILIVSMVYICVSIGCFWQLVAICHIYFDYPIIVSIDTEVKEWDNELPALTFCTTIEENYQNSNESIAHYFEKYNMSKIIFEMSVRDTRFRIINNTTGEDLETNLIQTLNSVYTCFTFNSLIKRK